MGLRFSWDPRKAANNLRDRGVSFEEVVTAFGDPLSITIPDPLRLTDARSRSPAKFSIGSRAEMADFVRQNGFSMVDLQETE
jgi:uncharacterized DUF497 family protein